MVPPFDKIRHADQGAISDSAISVMPVLKVG
jgi:hypothetical protein